MKKMQPTQIQLHQKSRILEIAFENGDSFKLSCEYLRVYSPSAEVMGHGPGEGVLQVGKEDVTIVSIEPVGNYAIKPTYDDGHSSGIYSWSYLHELGANHDKYWQRYLDRLEEANYTRKSDRLNQGLN